MQTLKKIIPEQKVQTKIIKQLEAEGYYVLKLVKTNKNGIPDLLAIKNNECLFIEVKREDGKLSEVQKYRLNELKEKGIKAVVAYGINFNKE